MIFTNNTDNQTLRDLTNTYLDISHLFAYFSATLHLVRARNLSKHTDKQIHKWISALCSGVQEVRDQA